MTQRELFSTFLITVASMAGAMAVPLMAESSGKVIIGTGMVSFSTTFGALLIALKMDPRSQFGGGTSE